jgi:hypothetical protein
MVSEKNRRKAKGISARWARCLYKQELREVKRSQELDIGAGDR